MSLSSELNEKINKQIDDNEDIAHNQKLIDSLQIKLSQDKFILNKVVENIDTMEKELLMYKDMKDDFDKMIIDKTSKIEEIEIVCGKLKRNIIKINVAQNILDEIK